MAPEIMKHYLKGTLPEKNKDIENDKKQDIFSLGLILYELCFPMKTSMQRNLMFIKLKKERVVECDL